MVRDPFSYFLKVRREYIRDWYWFAAAVFVIGFGIAFDAGASHPIGLVAAAGVALIGLLAGYLGYRRGLPLSGSQQATKDRAGDPEA